MNVYRRYFRVESGPLMDAAQECIGINAAATKEYLKILEEIGAESGYYHSRGKLVGIIFKDRPDPDKFKAYYDGWYPKKNTKTGRDLVKRIEAVETKDVQESLRVVGLTPLPTIFMGGKCYNSTVVVIPSSPPVIYVTVPWYDENPAVIAQYKTDRAVGTHISRDLDAITWEPTPEMFEVKEWEKMKAIDEWNESVRKGDQV